MRPGNEADYRSVEPFEERVRRLAHEFSELERLRQDIQRAEEMLKARNKRAGRASKNR
jgi:predicted RNase H-like nuclease (RuvC/YqgF family)